MPSQVSQNLQAATGQVKWGGSCNKAGKAESYEARPRSSQPARDWKRDPITRKADLCRSMRNSQTPALKNTSLPFHSCLPESSRPAMTSWGADSLRRERRSMMTSRCWARPASFPSALKGSDLKSLWTTLWRRLGRGAGLLFLTLYLFNIPNTSWAYLTRKKC